MVNKSKRNRFVGVAIFTAVIIMILLGLPQLLTIGKGGFSFEEIQKQFFSYSIWGLGFLIGILALFFVEQTITEKDSKYGSGLGFFSPNDKPGLNIPFFKSNINLILLSILIFGSLGLIATIQNQSFTGIGSLTQQQFTKLDNFFFRSLIIPVAENMGSAFFLAFLIFSLRAVARKYNWSSQFFSTLSIILGTLVVMSYGIINHIIRYSGQDTALLNVAFFWALGGFLSVIIGSFIPFWIQHFSNNAFYDFGILFSSDDVVLYTIFVLALVSFTFGYRLFKGKKR